MFYETAEDEAGFKAALKPLLAAEGTPVVNEALATAAATAAAAQTEGGWRSAMLAAMEELNRSRSSNTNGINNIAATAVTGTGTGTGTTNVASNA